MKLNKHGLSRYIPAEIKRIIRQNSGFGCVVCGLGITEYEHVDPPFNNAREHDPEKMTLLCPQCHTRVTKGFLSKKRIIQAMADPICLQQGYSNERFDFMNMTPRIVLGNVAFEGLGSPISIGGNKIFKIDPPEIKGGPFLLTATFTDRRGAESLKIVKNEWIASTGNWDVVVEGCSIVIREDLKQIHLDLQFVEPDTLHIKELRMTQDGSTVEVGETYTSVTNSFGQTISISNGTIVTGENATAIAI